MRSTELVNARLLRVGSGAGSSTDTYEGDAPAGPTKWEGDVGVWLEEIRDRRSLPAAQGSEVYVRRDLTVMADVGIDWQEGDVITLRRQLSLGGLEVTGTVQLVDLPEPPPGAPGEVRLTLELA